MFRMCQIILFAIIAALVIGCGDRTPEQQIEKVRDLVNAKKFEKAAEEVRALMKIKPTDSTLLFLGGLAYIGLEEYDSALSYAKKLTALYPRVLNGYRIQYEAAAKIGNYDAQLWAVGQMSYLDSTNRRQYYPEIAQLNFMRGDFGIAIATCREILTHDPGNSQVLFILASSLASIGRPDTAVTILRDIDARIPDQVEIVSNIATYLIRQNDYPLAEKEFRRLCRLYPDYVPGWYGLGNVLITRGDTAGAIGAYRSARSLDSSYLGVDSIIRSIDPLGLR